MPDPQTAASPTRDAAHLDTPAGSDTLEDWLRLAMLPGLGPRTLSELLLQFQTPRAVLAASRDELQQVEGIGATLAYKIAHAADHVAAAEIQAWCQRNDVAVWRRSQPGYPAPLVTLPDAPAILFARGQWEPSDALAVAIVGTRHATNYGRQQAERIAYGLARAGVTVISGLARGIDAAAHQGALDAGGRSLAVLGSGLAKLYPPEHVGLAKAIVADGAVISEYRPHAAPRGGMFPQRNRLISGLAMAVLVVEAPDRSGALITARQAGEQGREVLALPGPVNSRTSQGCLQLLRDGATLVRHADDVLEALGPAVQAIPDQQGHTIRNGSELLLNDQERSVLEAIEPQATAIDRVIQISGLPVQRVLATISVLESRRFIRRHSGQFVSRI